MINKKKGCYLHILKNCEEKGFIVEMGGEFDCFRIAVDFADLISIKNEIIQIEERVKQNDKDFDY